MDKKCTHPNITVFEDGYWNCPDCPENGNIDDEPISVTVKVDVEEWKDVVGSKGTN